MIIDFHTHTFPEAIAKRALEKLGTAEGLRPHTEGTNKSLTESMESAGVDISILLPVVTKVSQTENVNAIAAVVEEQSGGRLISFGGIHPEDGEYIQHLDRLKADGVRGIKLHPVFQRTYCDDIRYKRIVDKACDLDMMVLIHAGADISCPDAEFAAADHMLQLVRDVNPNKLILAHMGAWRDWNDAEWLCSECSGVYVDTAFVLPIEGREYFFETGIPTMSTEQFCRIVKSIGADRVLFGTDSPWADQLQSISAVRKSGLSEEEIDLILGGNAQRMLGIE